MAAAAAAAAVAIPTHSSLSLSETAEGSDMPVVAANGSVLLGEDLLLGEREDDSFDDDNLQSLPEQAPPVVSRSQLMSNNLALVSTRALSPACNNNVFGANNKPLPTTPTRTASTPSLSSATASSSNESSSNATKVKHIQVAIRVRPLDASQKTPKRRSRSPFNFRSSSSSSTDDDHHHAWDLDLEHHCLSQKAAPSPTADNGKQQQQLLQSFPFDVVFGPDHSTRQVYSQVCQPIVQATMTQGRHATIFAYGQTGSGKTFTMQGYHHHAQGLIQMAAADVFALQQQQQNQQIIGVKYFEIYNEQIRDLLDDSSREDSSAALSTPKSTKSKKSHGTKKTTTCKVFLNVVQDEYGNPTVNARQEAVHTMQDILSLLQRGLEQRACAATNRNATSSRSHAIFQMSIHNDASSAPTVLNLVDLAGSESASTSGATGVRLREGCKINLSLLSLSKVIQALSLPVEKRPKYIGYRDSKLTRILQPHLSPVSTTGNGCSVAMLCCVSTAWQHAHETKLTLQFASRAKQVEIRHKKPKKATNSLAEALARIQALQAELALAKTALGEKEDKLQRLQRKATCRSYDITGTTADVTATARPTMDDSEVASADAAAGRENNPVEPVQSTPPPVRSLLTNGVSKRTQLASQSKKNLGQWASRLRLKNSKKETPEVEKELQLLQDALAPPPPIQELVICMNGSKEVWEGGFTHLDGISDVSPPSGMVATVTSLDLDAHEQRESHIYLVKCCFYASLLLLALGKQELSAVFFFFLGLTLELV